MGKILVNYVMAICVVLSLNSCATLMAPKSVSTIIKSEPSGATVLRGTEVIGTTPYEYHVKEIKENGESFLLQYDGYDDLPIRIPVKSLSGYAGADALFLCIPCFFDLKNGKTYQIEEPEYFFTLTRPIPEHDVPIVLLIDETKTNIAENEILGKVNGESIKFSKKDLMSHLGRFNNYSQKISDELNRYYFKSRYIPKNSEANNSGFKARIKLVPKLLSIDAKMIQPSSGRVKGSGSIEMSFQFYSTTTDSLIYEQTVKSFVTKNEEYFYIIDQMISDLVKNIVSEKELYRVLSEGSTQALQVSIGSPIEMKKVVFPDAKDKKELFNRLVKSTVTVKSESGFGSGAVVSEDGYIVTNNHVVEGESEIEIEFSEGLSLKASVIRTNEIYDLALLKVDVGGLKALSFGDSETLALGEEVYAIGTGGDTQLGQSVSKGIVSGFRLLEEVPYVQTDVSINPGNSGGPLVNEKGELMGIATMKMVGDGIEGIGFCLPSNKVLEALNIKLN